ncbi:MAG TPA: cation diffusion facilitator family transporter [Acidimicrobiia bacterium]|nr:cation diffusion facilitator family transporter [Acidimicrobiia bacterium]
MRDHQHGHAGGHDHGRRDGPALRVVRRLVRTHSHDHADRVDGQLEGSAEGIRALWMSLAALAVTAAAQLVVVLVSGSIALLGDTLHNFADALTAVPLGLAFVVSRRPPNRRYTYGYGRAEDLAGIAVIAMIAISAIAAAVAAVARLLDPQPVHRVGWVIAAGVVGFAGNELAARFRIRTGRRIGSAALVADGVHARADGLTSLAVVAGAAAVAAGVPDADPMVGLLIAVSIAFVAKDAARNVYYRLMDAVSPELVDRARATVLGTPGVLSVVELRLRWVGHRLHAEAEITVDPARSQVEAHAVAHEAHHRLLHAIPRLDRVIVHASPADVDGVDHHTAIAHHEHGEPHSHTSGGL